MAERWCDMEKHREYIERVCDYYDTMTRLYLKYGGATLQAGQLSHSRRDTAKATNLYLASRAGIQPGHRILDCGCGVCGPSIDIARQIPDVQIDAITLSNVQAKIAKNSIRQARLSSRIQIYRGDYHDLPFSDSSFDVVFFFESTGYAYNRQHLFGEVFRVLHFGGRLYIKDVYFASKEDVSHEEKREMAEFDRIYAQQTPTLEENTSAISQAGFEDIYSGKLAGFTAERTSQYMVTKVNGQPVLTEFGEHHFYAFKYLSLIFGEITARKPDSQRI